MHCSNQVDFTDLNADFSVLAVHEVCVGAACNTEFRNCDSGAYASCRSGEVTSQRGGGWREGVKAEIYQRAAFLERNYIFNSVDRKFLKADPKAGDESLSSSMSTCQQLSCLTSPLLGMLRSGYQTTVNVEQNQTTHQIIKPRPTIWFANGGADPQRARSSYYFASNRDAIATCNAVTIATDLEFIFFFFRKYYQSQIYTGRDVFFFFQTQKRTRRNW